MTQAWLDTNGLGHVPLIMRNPDTHAPENTAQYKASAALSIGATHFWESEQAQALTIAREAPWLKVLQWNVETRVAMWVSVRDAHAAITSRRA